MPNEQKPTPATGQESDISKAKSQQQPAAQGGQQPESGEQRQPQSQAPDKPDEGPQGETATDQRTDIEGGSPKSEKDKAESGFVGAKGERDTSTKLVDKEDDEFKPDGQ